jgi:hypothetical protein
MHMQAFIESRKRSNRSDKGPVLRLTGEEAKRADQPKIRGVEELRSRDDRKVAQSDTFEKRKPFRGIAAEEWFLYEIMWLSLVITLTNLDDLLKIRDIQNKKKSG